MGLFNFKKRYQKNVTRENVLLKDYATKVNGLLIFTENSEKVTAELEALKNDFQYTVPTSSNEGKSLERKISKAYKDLAKTISTPDWNEGEVVLAIKGIRKMLVDISSLR